MTTNLPIHVPRFIAAIALGLGLFATGGIPSVQAQEAVLNNATGDCVTTGAPGNWTITCGDISMADGQSTVIAPPARSTTPLSTNPALAPAPAPAPVTEMATAPAPASGTATETAPTGNVATESDQDADNYSDALEADLGLDPSNADTDADGVADGDELILYSTQPLAWDTDGDEISDGEELFGIKTDPLVWDDLTAAATSSEPIAAAPESTATAPEAAPAATSGTLDADSDAISDVDEVEIYGTDPTLTDSDGDGIIDGAELFSTDTNPLVWDTDGDGLGDGETMSAESAGTLDFASVT